MQLFRLGKFLLLGTRESVSENVVTSEVRARLTEDGTIRRVSPVTIEVSEAFVINEDFDVSSLDEAEGPIDDYAALVHEAMVPILRTYTTLIGGGDVKGYSRSKGVLESTSGKWLPHTKALSNVQLGQTMAIEAIRPSLEALGLCSSLVGESVTEGYQDLQSPLHVYMKVEPFRDITKLHEGSPVSVLGYYKGCAVVEADGEMFWRPVEEANFYDRDKKDDDYYFRQDSNNDGIPDPLQSLPSKVALTGEPARAQDNWNAAPDLHKVAGHFTPEPTISNDDYGVMKEDSSFILSHGFEDFERYGDPENHDIDPHNEPALEPTDQDAAIAHQQHKRSILHHYSTSDDGAKNDGEDAMVQVLNHVAEGADLDYVLSAIVGGESKDAVYEKLRAEFFGV